MNKKVKINAKGAILDVVITQEKIKNKIFFVAQGIQLDVASQGLSLKEVLENIKDAANVILESSEEKRRIIKEEKTEMAPLITRIFL